MRSPESDGYRALSLYRVSTVGDAVSKHAEFLRSLDNAARLLGTTAEQAAKTLQAFGVAAKKLEDESKAMLDAHRARQPWWRDMALAAGWKDMPTVRQAFYAFNLKDFAERVAARSALAERERWKRAIAAEECTARSEKD